MKLEGRVAEIAQCLNTGSYLTGYTEFLRLSINQEKKNDDVERERGEERTERGREREREGEGGTCRWNTSVMKHILSLWT